MKTSLLSADCSTFSPGQLGMLDQPWCTVMLVVRQRWRLTDMVTPLLIHTMGSTGIEVPAVHNATALLAFHQCFNTRYYISFD